MKKKTIKTLAYEYYKILLIISLKVDLFIKPKILVKINIYLQKTDRLVLFFLLSINM